MSGSRSGIWISRALGVLGALVLVGASPALGEGQEPADEAAGTEAGAAPAVPKAKQRAGARGGPAARQNEVRDNPDRMLKKMTKELSLSEQQQAETRKILEAQATKTAALRKSAGQGADRSAQREQMMKIRTDSEAQVEAILDETQRKKFDEMRKERKKRFEEWSERNQGQRGGKGQRGGPGAGGS